MIKACIKELPALIALGMFVAIAGAWAVVLNPLG